MPGPSGSDRFAFWFPADGQASGHAHADEEVAHFIVENRFGVPLGALSEMAAVAIAENALPLAVAAEQADGSNGGLHGL